MNSFYLSHYFDFKNAGPFFLVSFLCLAGVLAVILVAARAQTGYHGRKDALNMDTRTLKAVRKTHFSLIESFYEMVFSSTAVLLFLSVYYLLDEYWSPLSQYWFKYRDILLLVFILLSVLVTSWFDVALVRLTHIKSEQKACIRLLSSFYIILILLYIKVIYQDDNYDTLIQYFLLLAAGRFLYFDFTWDWFKETVAGLWRNLPLLGLMAGYSAIVCWYGFKVDFLLKSNGVIVSTLIAHLFMDLCIFVMHKTRLLRFFIPSDADKDAALRDAQASVSRRAGAKRAADAENRNYAQRMGNAESRYFAERAADAENKNYAQRMGDAESRYYARRAADMENRNYAQRAADMENRNYAQRMAEAAGNRDLRGYDGSAHRTEPESHLNYAQRMGNAESRYYAQRAADAENRNYAQRMGLRQDVQDVEEHEGTHIIRNPEELRPEEDEIHIPEYKLDETERNALAHDARMGNSKHLNYYQRKKEEE
ncbi:MAG: hypothetical protein SPE66_02215 [Bilifractor sp.]|nr:hypothetical protein [Bilifractor sp.]